LDGEPIGIEKISLAVQGGVGKAEVREAQGKAADKPLNYAE